MLILLAVVGIGILAANVAILTSGFVIYRRISQNLRAFVEPTAEGGASPLAELTKAMGNTFGDTLFINIKRHIAVPMNHLTRQENAITAEMTGAAIEEAAPQWSALLGLLPGNVQKRVLKNPTAAAALITMLTKGGGTGTGTGAGNGSGNNGSVLNRLKSQS